MKSLNLVITLALSPCVCLVDAFKPSQLLLQNSQNNRLSFRGFYANMSSKLSVTKEEEALAVATRTGLMKMRLVYNYDDEGRQKEVESRAVAFRTKLMEKQIQYTAEDARRKRDAALKSEAESRMYTFQTLLLEKSLMYSRKEAEMMMLAAEEEKAALKAEAESRMVQVRTLLLKKRYVYAAKEADRMALEAEAKAKALAESNAVAVRTGLLKYRLVYDACDARKAAEVRAYEFQKNLLLVSLQNSTKEMTLRKARRESVFHQLLLKTRLDSELKIKTLIEAKKAQIEARIQAIANARKQPKPEDEEAVIASKYASMSEEDRAFYILLDLGIITETPDPSDNDDFGDEFCSDYD